MNSDLQFKLIKSNLNRYFSFGAHPLHIGKIIPYIVKLLSDTNQQIREKSFETLLELYRHVGDRLRNDLHKRQIPEAK